MSTLSLVFPGQKVFHTNFLNLGIERPSLVTNFLCSGLICPCWTRTCAQNRSLYRTIFEFAPIRTVNPKSEGRGFHEHINACSQSLSIFLCYSFVVSEVLVGRFYPWIAGYLDILIDETMTTTTDRQRQSDI